MGKETVKNTYVLQEDELLCFQTAQMLKRKRYIS